MKKLTALALSMIILLTLVSCASYGSDTDLSSSGNANSSDHGSDTNSSSTGNVNSSDNQNPADTDMPNIPDLVLAEDGITSCMIIFPVKASDQLIASTLSFCNELDAVAGLSGTQHFRRAADVSTYSADKLEILIGETSRAESAAIYADIPENSYIIRVVGNKLVIAASHDNLIPFALTHFSESFLKNNKYAGEGFIRIPGDTNIIGSSDISLPALVASPYHITASFKQVYTYSGIGDHKYTQGACTDGSYVYHTLYRKDENGVESSYIAKVRMSDWTQVAVSELFYLNHANDMCYNPDKNILVVANMSGQLLTVIDPETLTIKEKVTLDLGSSFVPYAITYSSSRKQYVIAAGGRFVFLDENFKYKADRPKYSNSDYVGQGMDSDENFIYMPMSNSSAAGTNDNIILVFDWNGKLLDTITIPTRMESETMFNVNGVMYVSFNNHSSGVKGYMASLQYLISY